MIRRPSPGLYEDMGPIRIAGDLIYNTLASVAADESRGRLLWSHCSSQTGRQR